MGLCGAGASLAGGWHGISRARSPSPSLSSEPPYLHEVERDALRHKDAARGAAPHAKHLPAADGVPVAAAPLHLQRGRARERLRERMQLATRVMHAACTLARSLAFSDGQSALRPSAAPLVVAMDMGGSEGLCLAGEAALCVGITESTHPPAHTALTAHAAQLRTCMAGSTS